MGQRRVDFQGIEKLDPQVDAIVPSREGLPGKESLPVHFIEQHPWHLDAEDPLAAILEGKGRRACQLGPWEWRAVVIGIDEIDEIGRPLRQPAQRYQILKTRRAEGAESRNRFVASRVEGAGGLDQADQNIASEGLPRLLGRMEASHGGDFTAEDVWRRVVRQRAVDIDAA